MESLASRSFRATSESLVSVTALAHWHEFVSKTAKFARLLGKTDDARRFESHAGRIAERFRRLYVKAGGVVNKGF